MSGRVVLLVALAALVLFTAGCGGSETPALANVGPSAPAAGQSTSTEPVAPSGGAPDIGSNPAGGPAAIFDACLRTHGVPNMPGPLKSLPAGVNPTSSKFENAERECAKLVPQDAPPAIVSHPVAPLLAFAKCMRSHGVTSFPDPDDEGHFHDGQMQGIDPNSSLFQRTITTCRPLADNEPIARVP